MNNKDPFDIIPFESDSKTNKEKPKEGQKRNLFLRHEGKFIIIEWKGKKTIIDFHKSIKEIREEVKKAVFALEGINLIEDKEERRRKEAWLEREIYSTIFDFISDLNAKGVFLEAEENIIYTPFLVLNDGRIAEEGFDGKEVYYIVYDPKTEKIEKMKRIEQDGKVYLPIFNDDVKNYQVLFPSWPEEYGSEEQLIKDIEDYLSTWYDYRNINDRKTDVGYCFHTYVYDLFPNTAYRRALGEAGGGKSTWLEVLGSICYRPMFLAGCNSEASLRRTFDLWRGTAIIDEADFHNTSLYSTIIKILNIGYSRSQGWYRCCDDKNPSKILAFYVYGPKLLATRRSFDDIALESRCLTFHSFENITPKPLFRMDKFKEQALRLRNKLLLWRFRNYYKFKEKVSKLEEPNLVDELYKDADVKSRIKQILTPLALISEDIKNGISALAKELSEEIKALDQDAEFEEQIRKAVKELITGSSGACGTCRGALREVPVIRIRIKDIAKKILEEEGEKIDSKTLRSMTTKLGRFFRDKLSFKRELDKNERISYVFIPKGWIEEKPELRGLIQVPNVPEVPLKQIQKVDIPFKAICEICSQEAIIEEIIDGHYVCSKCKKEEEERLKALRGCETCKYFNKDASYCLLTNTLTTPTSTCDNWSPKEPKEAKKENKSQETSSKDKGLGFTCSNCKHHDSSLNKCKKRPEWAFVSPFHLFCELFEKRDDEK